MWRDEPLEGLRLLDMSENLSRDAGSNAASFLANVLNTKGVIYRKLGELENASDAFKEALQIVRSLSVDTNGLPAIIDNSAQILQAKGDKKQALDLYLEALELRKVGLADPDGILTSLSNIVSLLIEIGKDEEARNYLDELINLIKQQLQEEFYSLNCVDVCLKVAQFSESLEDVDNAIELSLTALALGRRVCGHGTRRYLEDALNSIAMWLRMGKPDVVDWFIRRSLLALPESIRPAFWINSASLCLAYKVPETGIQLLKDFVDEYTSSEVSLLQSLSKNALMLIEDNKKNCDTPSLIFWLPPNFQLDLPSNISQPPVAVHISWDMELHARIEDYR